LFALGGLFVLVTLYLPKGIAGLLPHLLSKKDNEEDSSNTNDTHGNGTNSNNKRSTDIQKPEAQS